MGPYLFGLDGYELSIFNQPGSTRSGRTATQRELRKQREGPKARQSLALRQINKAPFLGPYLFGLDGYELSIFNQPGSTRSGRTATQRELRKQREGPKARQSLALRQINKAPFLGPYLFGLDGYELSIFNQPGSTRSGRTATQRELRKQREGPKARQSLALRQINKAPFLGPYLFGLDGYEPSIFNQPGSTSGTCVKR